MTAVCRAREQCPFKTACCRNGEVGRIARRGRADQRAIRAVAEVVGIADDIQAVIVVIAAVHPVINIVPPAFDVAILREAVAVAACRGRTGVITHRVGLTVVHLGTVRRAASADALAVPIGKLHEEQHVHIPELSEIHLPEVSTEVMNTAARLASRDVYLLCGARGGLITAGAVITADVGVVQLAKAVPAVPVYRVNGEALHITVRDLELQLLSGLCPLEPILRLFDFNAAAAGLLHHAGPRHQVVEWRRTSAVVYCGVRFSKAGRRVRALAFGGAAACPIPLNAVDRDESGRHIDRHIRSRLVVRPLSDLDGDLGRAGRVVHALNGHNAGALIDGFDLRDARVVRGGCDRTVALAVHRKGCGLGTALQHDGARRIGHAVHGLADRPRCCLASGAAIRPLVVGSRRKGSAVSACVGSGRHGNGHLCRVIGGIPRRSLRVAVISQRAVLGGDRRDGSSADGPLDGLCRGRTVRPHTLLQGKGRHVLAGIRLGRYAHRGVLIVEILPLRRLGAAVVGQRTALRRNGNEHRDDRPLHFLGACAAVGPLVVGSRSKGCRVLTGSRTGGIAANGHLVGVIAVPARRLARAVGNKRSRLRRKSRDDSAVDRPLYAGLIRAVREQIAVGQLEDRRVTACVRGARNAGDLHFEWIVAVPARRLVRTVVGRDVRLRRNGNGLALHRNDKVCALCHAFVGVFKLHDLTPQCREVRRRIGVIQYRRRATVREGRCHDHARRIKALLILVDRLGWLHGDGDADKHLFHRHGNRRGLRDATLGVGDDNFAHPVRKNGGRDGVTRHICHQTFAVVCHNDHAGGVESFTGLIDRLVGRGGDSQTFHLRRAAATAAGKVEYLANITHLFRPPVE